MFLWEEIYYPRESVYSKYIKRRITFSLMKAINSLMIIVTSLYLLACTPAQQSSPSPEVNDTGTFEYFSEQFADLKILRYHVPGFEELSLQEKKLLYYLYQASLSGRDIIYDQNYKHNLRIRRSLEAIIRMDGNSGNEYDKLLEYTKRIWFSNGIHHHYSNDKILPEFSQEYFAEMIHKVPAGLLPLAEGQSPQDLIDLVTPIMFDPDIAAKRVNKNTKVDIVETSAVNFYEGVSQGEVEAFYDAIIDPDDDTPISYGLNSKLVKENGSLKEKIWKANGMYGDAIGKIVYWLEEAAKVAENDAQKEALTLLAKYYSSGNLEDFDTYNIAWVADTNSNVDVINGFIEVYNDPVGKRGAYESVVSIRDPEASKRIEAISKEAQWFEDHAPIMDAHKKKNVQGIAASVINVVIESGDAAPATPIGINLPNSNWIRKNHGSKSVSLNNIMAAYNEASKGVGGMLEEFAASEAEVERSKKYGYLADLLHTDLHEVLGHASGQIEDGVGTPDQTLPGYASTIEEGRADLFALYFLMDPRLIELGLIPSMDVAKAGYDDYIRNGLVAQLRRIKMGDDIEEDHMRNRAWVSWWVYNEGRKDNVIERIRRDGKTYFRVNNFDRLRQLFGQLLREVQRIKSQGDLKAAKELVETFGVKIDPKLHEEVLERYASLGDAPYSGFINPMLIPKMSGQEIEDVSIKYPTDFTEQMLYYANNYSFLPNDN